MDERKQTGIRTLAEAFQALPDGKKEYLLGFAEGVIAAREPPTEEPEDTQAEEGEPA